MKPDWKTQSFYVCRCCLTAAFKQCSPVHTWHGQPEQNSFHRLLRQWGGVLGKGRENLYRTGPYHCFTSNHALAGAEAFLQAKERYKDTPDCEVTSQLDRHKFSHQSARVSTLF